MTERAGGASLGFASLRGRLRRPCAAGASLGFALALALAAPAAADPLAVHVDPIPAGPSVEERLAEIARRVQAVATYPPSARARAVSGETWVALRVAADGTPDDVHTERSSGSLSLDRAAERAVRDAAPLPRVVGTVTVPVRFQLTGD